MWARLPPTQVTAPGLPMQIANIPNALLVALTLLVLPSYAMAQGVGPSEGPLPAGVPAENPAQPWIFQLELKGVLAGGGKVIGMNRLPGRDDVGAIGSRYLVSGKLAFGRQIDTPVLEGIFGFVELISTHGRNANETLDAWSVEQVAWVRYAAAGILLPRGWWLYVEGQNHWNFSDDELGGPYEIYNMVLVGRGFDVTFGSADNWFLKGYLEGGISWPHNEVSVNLRRFDQPETEFFGDNYGRYALRGTVHLGARLDRGVVRELSIYANPYFIFGRTIPQQEYTWEADYIGTRRNFGGQVILGDDFRVFAEYQAVWHFRDKIAVPPTGPYENYFVLGVSKIFDWQF